MANQVIFTMTGVGNSEYTPVNKIFEAIRPYGHFISGDDTDGTFELYDNSRFVLKCPIFPGQEAKCISSVVHIVNGQFAPSPGYGAFLVFEGFVYPYTGEPYPTIYVYNDQIWNSEGDTFINNTTATIERVEIEGEKFLNQDGVGAIRDWVKSQTGSLSSLTTTNKDNLVNAINEVAGNSGVNFEVGVEKPYGTYKEGGVTYPVYSKIVYISALPSTAGITNYPHGITNIKQILAVYGSCSNSMVMNAPRQNNQDNICIYQVQKSGNIAIEVGKDRSSISAYVTLIYAKNV